MDHKGILIRRAEARVGSVLREKWTLDRLLGVGGMASVYAGTHRNGKQGAVKMLHLELSNDADARKRFLREGYVANQVNHSGAVSVLDDDVGDDGSVFLVMELLEGMDAEAYVDLLPDRKLDPGELVWLADRVLDVLISAHEKGIVHRDIKPENLFLTNDGGVKILDFGIARLRDISGSSNATRTGTTMGTPAFMPPEQALGNSDQIDARTDVWALGATMFTLLTGREVHEADTVNKLLLAAMTRPAPKVRSVLPSLPAELAAIVDQALAFDQKDRFQDARSMQLALRALTKNSQVIAAPVTPPVDGYTPRAPSGADYPQFGLTPASHPKLSGDVDAAGRVSRVSQFMTVVVPTPAPPPPVSVPSNIRLTASPVSRDSSPPSPAPRRKTSLMAPLFIGAALLASALAAVAFVVRGEKSAGSGTSAVPQMPAETAAIPSVSAPIAIANASATPLAPHAAAPSASVPSIGSTKPARTPANATSSRPSDPSRPIRRGPSQTPRRDPLGQW